MANLKPRVGIDIQKMESMAKYGQEGDGDHYGVGFKGSYYRLAEECLVISKVPLRDENGKVVPGGHAINYMLISCDPRSFASRLLRNSGYTSIHAKNVTAADSVVRFWGKTTMPNAGTMPYRRDLPSTTRI